VGAANGFDPDAPLLLSTGRLLPLKGFHDLLAAVASLACTRPELRLIIAGPNFVDATLGDQRAALRRTLAELHLERQVVLRDSLQHETEMPQYLLAADLLAAVARIEGMNRVVPEAGALGTPAVVSDMTGIAPTVAADRAGIVVPACDPPAIAAAIERLIAAPELRAEYGARARRLAQRFRSAVIADQLLELYAASVEQRRRDQPAYS
jgi:2-deoxystreptamine N-acetyl-D-glucosaminyltransferase/2-deoxystreptamine glucosyltransferase